MSKFMLVCLYSGCAHNATEIINNSSYNQIKIHINISTKRTILFLATRIRHIYCCTMKH